jgi:hypothetical protein
LPPFQMERALVRKMETPRRALEPAF